MEFISFSLPSATLFTVFAILLSLFLCISTLIRYKKGGNHAGEYYDTKRVHEASGYWPLLGHLHLLGGPEPAHLVLAQLAYRFGPMFTVRLGIHRAIVVNTWEIAKECLTTHDRTFATRPKSLSSDIMTYNYAFFGLSPYGSYWRHVRKISTLELLSNHQLELLKHVRESEVNASVKDAYERWRNRKAPETTVLVDMKRLFGDITLNVIFRMVVGKRFSDGGVDEKAGKALTDFFKLVGLFVVSDGLPFLRWLDIGGHIRVMRRTVKELDQVVERWLDEHKAAAKRKQNSGDHNGDDQKTQKNFMHALLLTLEDSKEVHTYDADTVIKATCLNMILGASDTTTVSLTWAFSLLVNHKESLNKVQQELDTNVGRKRQITESDLKNLPYLQAVVKETLRLYPAVPLAAPHEAIEDCTFHGYFIPKGTRLLFNLYKIQRDSRVWSDPYEFKPERFLTTHKDFDVRGRNFEFMPFGSGRRMCPGISLALQLVELSLASFLQAFNVQTPGDELVDMTEGIGLTNLKATPLEVFVSPRLPECVYQWTCICIKKTFGICHWNDVFSFYNNKVESASPNPINP